MKHMAGIMKQRILSVLFLSWGLLSAGAQTVALTLEACLHAARTHYPAISRYDLISQSRDYTLANAARGYLPQVSVSAGANLFTDVMELPANMEAQLGGIKNELYTAGVQVEQVIYDGGAIAARRSAARAEADVQGRQTDVTLYAVREQVEEIFFGILLLDRQLSQTQLLMDDLEVNRRLVTSLLRGGMAMQSDLDLVEVRRLEACQRMDGIRTQRTAYLRMLGCFMGTTLTEGTSLTPPVQAEAPQPGTTANSRPELDLFSARTASLEARRKALNAAMMPRLGLFGMAMLHNKVVSPLRNNLLVAGVSLNWNIGALYTRHGDLRSLELQRQQIDTDRATFLFNNRLQGEQTHGQIASLRSQIASDEKIIALRERIRQSTVKRVESGTETVNELLLQVNAVNEAHQMRALHEVTLLKEIYRMKTITNL